MARRDLDGFVIAQHVGEVGANEMLGTEADLDRNLLALIESAGLDEDEVREFGRLQRERIVGGEAGRLTELERIRSDAVSNASVAELVGRGHH
jgi:hypothetical protein